MQDQGKSQKCPKGLLDEEHLEDPLCSESLKRTLNPNPFKLFFQLSTWSFPNLLSLSRVPLALLLFSTVPLRLLAIFLAMMTDALDGYFARKWKQASAFGGFLDPLTDKFFVFTAVSILFFERQIYFSQVLLFLVRDIFLFFVVCFLVLSGRWKEQACIPSIWGKLTTFTQFCILIGLTLNVSIPSTAFAFCGLLGGLASWEVGLLLRSHSR